MSKSDRRMKSAAIVLVVVLAPLLGAAEPAPENLERWQYRIGLTVPAGIKGRADFLVTPAVFARAKPDLSDLLLIDEKGNQVPYALRTRSARYEQQRLDVRKFNMVTTPEGESSISLDLGESPPEHNEIEVDCPGKAYGRPLRIEGSPDDKTWSILLEGVDVVNLDIAGQRIQRTRFSYPPSRLRYLRVRVRPDRAIKDDKPTLGEPTILHRVEIPGEEVSRDVPISGREPARDQGVPASVWRIDLGDEDVPCDRLQVLIADEEFARSYKIEAIGRGERPSYVTGGEFRRLRGQPTGTPINVPLGSEVRARTLLITVTDNRNPPLDLTRATAFAAAREIVFAPTSGGDWNLYFGNPSANAPQYDFAATLPVKLEPAPTRLQLGSLDNNLTYRPIPKPWTERNRWLVDAVLIGSSVVLVGILLLMARTAIRRQDAVSAT